LSFWIYEFIKSKYDHVEVRFITHTTDAKLVTEDEFFRTGESGGTCCHTAFDLVERLIDTEYSPSEYNIYIQYFSDGEDFRPEETMKSIKRLVDRQLNMICYCEIQPGSGSTNMWGSPQLMDNINSAFRMVKVGKVNEFYRNTKLKIFTGLVQKKEHIYEYLKHILFKE